MRVVRGRVVGKTVVLDEALPEGAEVEVREAPARDADGWTLDEASWRELEAAMAEADRGELVSAEAVLAELKTRS